MTTETRNWNSRINYYTVCLITIASSGRFVDTSRHIKTLRQVNVKISWDVTLCHWLSNFRRLEGPQCLRNVTIYQSIGLHSKTPNILSIALSTVFQISHCRALLFSVTQMEMRGSLRRAKSSLIRWQSKWISPESFVEPVSSFSCLQQFAYLSLARATTVQSTPSQHFSRTILVISSHQFLAPTIHDQSTYSKYINLKKTNVNKQ